ncbi:MAG: hypothetical protein KGI69_03705 [Patescibacteria group bacterium]|nr:hypothetical protein [Patescibacteria group bacterium]
MFRDYEIVSPSLEGILSEVAVEYEGVRRPTEILRAMDGPAAGPEAEPACGRKILERYFYDIYGIFMKKLSHFVLDPGPGDQDTVKLQALLQEMIKVKRLIGKEKGGEADA